MVLEKKNLKVTFYFVLSLFIIFTGCATTTGVFRYIERKDVPSLVDILKDRSKSQFDRKYAAEGLGNIGDKSVVPDLIEELNDPDEEVREAVVDALGKLGDKAIVSRLITMVEDRAENPGVIGKALTALVNIGDKSAIPVMCKALEHEDSLVRLRAVEGLGEMGDKAVVPILLSRLRTEEKKLVPDLVIALGKIGDSTCVPSLLEMFPERGLIRSHIVWALGKIRDKSAIPVLLRMVKEKNMIVGIVEKILEIGGESILPSLEEVLNDKDEFFKIYARWASHNFLKLGGSIDREKNVGKNKLLREATKDFTNNNFREAAEKILETMRTYPNAEQIKKGKLTINLYPIACYNLGILYRSMGKIDEAREAFLAAIQLDPGGPIAAPAILNHHTIYSPLFGSKVLYYNFDDSFLDIEGNSFSWRYFIDMTRREVSFMVTSSTEGVKNYDYSPITPLGLGWFDFAGKSFKVR